MNTLTRKTRRGQARRARLRLGAVLSMELILVLPIVLGLVFSIIEFGMLWSSSQRVKDASTAGCRTASFRGADESAIRRAVEQTLGRPALIANYSIDVRQDVSNEVSVIVAVPMRSAAPDLLRFVGFALDGRRLSSQTVMRKE
jgi:Flp pilus assembly protein TadG